METIIVVFSIKIFYNDTTFRAEIVTAVCFAGVCATALFLLLVGTSSVWSEDTLGSYDPFDWEILKVSIYPWPLQIQFYLSIYHILRTIELIPRITSEKNTCAGLLHGFIMLGI